jgi:hypothetical protein
MRTFKDILGEGFDKHARALPAGGGLAGGRARSTLRSIRRRRTARVATVAGASALTVGALAVGAMALRPPLGAQPGSTPVNTNGLYPWCDVSTYPAVNPEALGAARYQGRLYEDFVNLVLVYVAPDGTHRTLEAEADGMYRLSFEYGGQFEYQFPADMPDFMENYPEARAGLATDLGLGLMDSFYDPGGLEGPHLGYEWTTVVPDVVPSGVDVAALSETLAPSLGLSGQGYVEAAMPEGAIVETIFRWHDGRQVAIRNREGDHFAEVPDYTDLASVSVRVSNLPDGEVFEITSTYDPSMTWEVACWPYRDATSPTATATVGPTPTPTYSWGETPAPSPGVSQGRFDAGPTPSPSFVTPAPSPSATRPSASPSPSP